MTKTRAEAQQINDVFKKHRVGFRIDTEMRWRETPAYTLYKIEKDTEEQAVRLHKLQPDLAHAVHDYRERNGLIREDERTCVRVTLQPLCIEVNAIKPQALHYSDVQWKMQPHTALCGMYYAVRGEYPVLWNPADSMQPHALVAGTTGSGKTTLVQSIVLSLCAATNPNDLQFTIVDFKNSPGLRSLTKAPHITRMLTEENESLAALQSFHNEIIHRKRHGFDNAPRRIMVIDELAEFTASDDKSYREQTTGLLHSIARLGREFKMHLIVCTQKPTSKVIGEQLKSNLPLRLVGMVTAPEESKVATGIAGAGAHLLPGKGSFIRVNGGTVQRFQVPIIDDVVNAARSVRSKWRDEIVVAPTIPPVEEPKKIVEPIVHKIPPMQVEQDAATIRTAWQDGVSQADLIRIMLGKPGDMTINTGGANRRRMLEAVAHLSATTITTTPKKTVLEPENVASFNFRGSSGSSSGLKPM